jgi:phosphate starvation-inducible protein PhoH
MPDNTSTELALIKLLSDQLADVRALSARVEHLSEHIGRLEHQSQHRHQQIMTALETLTASVTAATEGQASLTTAVNAAIVRLGNPGATDAQLLTLAAAIDGLSASDVSLTNALNAALNPPPPPAA